MPYQPPHKRLQGDGQNPVVKPEDRFENYVPNKPNNLPPRQMNQRNNSNFGNFRDRNGNNSNRGFNRNGPRGGFQNRQNQQFNRQNQYQNRQNHYQGHQQNNMNPSFQQPDMSNGFGRQLHAPPPEPPQQFQRGNRGYNNRNRGNNRGGYNQNRHFGSRNFNRGGGFGRQQNNRHYKMDYNDRHSSFENKKSFDKSVFDDHSNSAGINFDDYDKIEVKTENFDNFEPAESFETAGIVPALLKNIKLCGFKKPTPIQKYSLPVVMAERDLMACAQTGSGKTAAFLLPIINVMLKHPKAEIGFHSRSKCYPKALILSPTRELAQQIHKDCMKFLYQTGLGCGCIFGGSKVDKQLHFMENNPIDILVATVGRLWDFFERGKLSFEDVHYFILDEADNMLDMGFERQINMILYESDLSKERLNLLFSATMPKEIQTLCEDFLNDYVFLSFGMVGSVTALVEQQFRKIDKGQKLDELMALLSELGTAKILVFVAMKRTADELEWEMKKSKIGKCIAIHGDKTQRDRERALQGFRKGRYNVMIATDVAARGLDIKDVSHVIQYDMPGNVDSYVHRVGRTGRCGNKGTAIAFINDDNKNVLKPLIAQLTKEGLDIPKWLVDLSRKFNRGGYRGRGKRYGYKRNYRNNRKGNNKKKW